MPWSWARRVAAAPQGCFAPNDQRRANLPPCRIKPAQAYGFPGGKQELQAAISSAVSSSLDNHPRAAATLDTAGGAAGGGAAAAAAAPPPAIGRDAFWGLEARRGDAFKFDLLAAAPWLRALLRSDAWPEALNHGFSKHAFGVMLLGLVLGPQVGGQEGRGGEAPSEAGRARSRRNGPLR